MINSVHFNLSGYAEVFSTRKINTKEELAIAYMIIFRLDGIPNSDLTLEKIIQQLAFTHPHARQWVSTIYSLY